MKEQSERDHALIGALEAEASLAAEFYTNEISEQQIEAFKRYYGEPYGDEVEGRSQVVSRETFETVEWTRGDLRRVFSSGGRIVECDAQTDQEDEYAEDAADYLNYVFFTENPGRRLLSSFIFDGLLQKRGYLAAFWREAEYDKPEKLKDLGALEFEAVMKEPDVELEGEPVETTQAEKPEDWRIDVTIKRLKKKACIEVQCIAPDDMRVNARYESVDDMPCVGHDIRVTVSELCKEYPKHATDIMEAAGANLARDHDERRAARFINQEEDPDAALGSSELTNEVIVKCDYIHFDYDDDGYAELRAVKRLGDLILENEEVEENPYASWTPNHIPHLFFGLSAHDEVSDIERVKTVTTRSALDAMYQAVAPRMAVNASTVNLTDCLSVRPGGLIRVDGVVTEGLMPITVPDQSEPALAMSEYWDKLAERRTGVQRRAQALDPDALHKTYKGEKLLQNAQSVRKEDKAANCAEGLESLFSKMYRLCCDYMDEPRTVRLSKKKSVTVAPQGRPQPAPVGAPEGYEPPKEGAWRKDMKLTVHVGLGTGAKEEQLALLQVVQGAQAAWVSQFGFTSPQEEGAGGVSPAQMFNLTEEMLRVMGFRTAGAFFTEPSDDWRPQSQPSPEMAKVEAEKEAKQAELQLKAQSDEKEAQLDMQKLQMEMQLKREQIQAELQLKREQMIAEMQLKREMAMVDAEVKRTLAAKGIPPTGGGARPNGGGSTSKVNVGGDPG